MLELNPYRKNKVNLEDYDYQKDISNRLLLSTLTEKEVTILEEILFSPPKLPILRLSKDLDISIDELTPALEKFESTGLFEIKADVIFLNKEMRKYFETHTMKFEEGFIPGMEYLQQLLRKVPIDVLLTWYPIPRTSNNIFDSLIEKFLLTPQVYQRYLMELNFGDTNISSIIDDVFNSESLMIPVEEAMEKYSLNEQELEELILHLEFNFVCCAVYVRDGDSWKRYVTPFHEWREYLRFSRNAFPKPIEDTSSISTQFEDEFAFVRAMSLVLESIKETTLPMVLGKTENWQTDTSQKARVKKLLAEITKDEEVLPDLMESVIKKLLFLKLAKVENSHLLINEGASDWLSLSLENKALSSYKHTLTRLEYLDFSPEVATERNVREIEKCLNKTLHLGWVSFDDFLKTITPSLGDESKIIMKKTGRSWKYALPRYSDEEKALIRITVMQWLFEAGLVSVGSQDDTDCFCVTAFGQSIFS